MTDRLSLYNGALLECGERKLVSLSENREPRRLLDDVYDNGLIDFVLNTGQWKFAKRTVKMAPSTSIEPDFGYHKAYPVPEDFIRTTSMCSDEYMNVPLLQYTMERGYWFADVEPIYVSYISNDPLVGGANVSLWPPDFCRYVEAYLASRVVRKLTQDKDDWTRLFKLAKQRLTEASSTDAMEGPTVFPPIGSWVSSRFGRNTGRRDRGNRGSLIG